MSSGPGGIQGVGQRWAGRGSHENWKHEEWRSSRWKSSHDLSTDGRNMKTTHHMEHGFGHVEMGWTIMEYIFSTGVPNDTSKRGTNLQFSQGNKSSILLRSHCAVACWHSVLQVPTWCLVVGENGVLGKHNIFCGSLARVAVAFSLPSFKHVSVQRMFRFLITMFDMFAKRNKWFATTVWKRFFQIQGTSIRTYSLASTRSNYNVKRPAAIAKNVGTGDLSASPIPSGLLRSSARSNRATANVWTSLLCMLVLGNSCYRLFGKRIACPW